MAGELISFTLRAGEVTRGVTLAREVLENPAPVLREFGRFWLAETRAFMAAGGEGTWPPCSKSTREKYEHTGTSRITKQGTVRGDRVAKLAKSIASVRKAVQREGYTPQLRAKMNRLIKQSESLAKAERQTQRKAFTKRKIGKTLASQRKLLGRLPGSVRFKLLGSGVFRGYSKAGELAAVHDAGEGKNPKREFVRVTEKQLDHLVEMLETAVVEGFDHG